MPDEYSYLKRCNLFTRLASKQIERLASRCQICSYARRSPIYLPGEKAEAVLVLGHGRVKVSSLTDLGKETILTFIEPGECKSSDPQSRGRWPGPSPATRAGEIALEHDRLRKAAHHCGLLLVAPEVQ